MNVTYATIASTSGTPMTEVPAMFRNGMTPVRFMNSTMKKIVVRIGRNRLPSFLPRRSSAMFTRTRSRPISTRLWKRPGHDAHAARAEPEDEEQRDDGDELRTSVIRLISNGVPSNSNAAGKNSIDRRTVEATFVG